MHENVESPIVISLSVCPSVCNSKFLRKHFRCDTITQTVDWLIDWTEFYAVSAIFQRWNGGKKNSVYGTAFKFCTKILNNKRKIIDFEIIWFCLYVGYVYIFLYYKLSEGDNSIGILHCVYFCKIRTHCWMFLGFFLWKWKM